MPCPLAVWLVGLLLLGMLAGAADGGLLRWPHRHSAPVDGRHWAVLIAGSQGWGNYRHQADVCHAYHVVRRGGLRPENIVVLMADDIANNTANPNLGKIVNRPGGADVYGGVVIDYRGGDVTADTFLAVLAGDAAAVRGKGTGKVVTSGPSDTVFVYYSDHGGVHTLAMPYGGALTAHRFVAALQAKAARKEFRKMTVYIEACHSASMVQDLLPSNLNIYVTTASSAEESSYATYCPPHSTLDTCLGDLYSVAFLENEDIVDPRESLEAQYETVKLRASNQQTYEEGSHVLQFGSLDLDQHAVGEFMGSMAEPTPGDARQAAPSAADVQVAAPRSGNPTPPGTNVEQHDADVLHLFHRYLRSNGEDKFVALRALHGELGFRVWLEDVMSAVLARLLGPQRGAAALLSARPPRSAADEGYARCFETLLQAWQGTCGSSQYLLRYTHAFAHLCHNSIPVDQGVAVIEDSCRRALRAKPPTP